MGVMLVWLCGVLVAYWISPVTPVTEASTATPVSTTDTLTTPTCAEETVGSYEWPATEIGANATLLCPGSTEGDVYRYCDNDTTWSIQDFTRCKSTVLANLELEALDLDDSASSALLLAVDLQNASKPSKLIVSGDLVAATSILYTLIEHSLLSSCNTTSSIVKNFTEAILMVTSQLLDEDYSSLWNEVHQVSDANAVLNLLQKLTTFYDETISCMSNIDIHEVQLSTVNMDASLITVPANASGKYVYPTVTTTNNDQVTVPIDLLTELDSNNKSGLAVVIYRTVTSLLPSTDLNSRLASSEGQLNSDILSVVMYPSQVQPLEQPILLQYSHLQSATNPVCALMNYALTTSIWSTDECETVSTASDVTSCNCFHATHFALLMTIEDGSTVKVPLNSILVAGVVVAMFFLLATFVMLLFVNRSFEFDWALVVKCFLFTMMVSDITFLSGINATVDMMICRMVGVILHYLYLSVFFWMLAQAVLLELKIVHISSASASVFHYCLLGWVTPLLVVAGAAGLKHKNYGNSYYCWLSINDPAVYGFIGPTVFVIIVNVVVLCFVIHGFLTIKKNRHKGMVDMNKLKPAIRATIITLPCLMITWFLKSFAIEKNTEPTYTVYAICNILQGILIFILYGVLDVQVQIFYRNKFGHNHKAVQDSSPKAWSDKTSENNKTSPNNFRASSLTSFSSRASESVATIRNDSTASISSAATRRFKKTLVLPMRKTTSSPGPSNSLGQTSKSLS
uniref:Cadherin EGF LAG seven-pass G-type receptor 2-like n=1 Tax=Saccoglossus kowalevskii TaxID=10224 RepID=A0ABM0GX93_SACKO|nr:PREDICTED: cadherin EGF LAG seven-pass G-type receptor 2-like [Saccoglossus kowalevskii]